MTAQPEDFALRLLAPAALAYGLVSLLLVLFGASSEAVETRAWVLAFLVAVPLGLYVGDVQVARLRQYGAAGMATAVAAGTIALCGALLLRYAGSNARWYFVVAGLGAAVALAAPFVLASRPRWIPDAPSGPRIATAIAAATALVLFAPISSLRPGVLAASLALAAVAWAILRTRRRLQLPRWLQVAFDALAALAIAGFVTTFPDLNTQVGYTAVHHDSFFLGPANDVLHGRAMLDGAWGQYGMGLTDALALFFTTNTPGFGHLFLLVVGLTCVQYVVVYSTLRLSGLPLVLAFVAVVVAALANIYATEGWYAAFPSITPLRFGLPYLLILLAVIEARGDRPRRWLQAGQLLVVAVAAVWSFEAWIYTGATYAAIALIQAMIGEGPVWKLLLRRALLAVGVSVASVAVFTLGTAVLSGGADWGPYLDMVSAYSNGLSQMPIIFFSPGPLMAAEFFLSAVALLLIARDRAWVLPGPVATALAGYTGFAIASFTYYLGRSHPNNLLNLAIPPVVIGFLWLYVILGPRREAPLPNWRRVAAAALLVVGATVATTSWNRVAPKWPTTAIAKVVPLAGQAGSPSLPASVQALWRNPVMDPRAPEGVQLLKRYLPGQERSLVLMEPDITTEILVSAQRGNVLPISHAPMDEIGPGSAERSRQAALAIKPGTRMLFAPPLPAESKSPLGGEADYTEPQLAAYDVLRQRFRFRTVAKSASGFSVVELQPR